MSFLTYYRVNVLLNISIHTYPHGHQLAFQRHDLLGCMEFFDPAITYLPSWTRAWAGKPLIPTSLTPDKERLPTTVESLAVQSLPHRAGSVPDQAVQSCNEREGALQPWVCLRRDSAIRTGPATAWLQCSCSEIDQADR